MALTRDDIVKKAKEAVAAGADRLYHLCDTNKKEGDEGYEELVILMPDEELPDKIGRERYDDPAVIVQGEYDLREEIEKQIGV